MFFNFNFSKFCFSFLFLFFVLSFVSCSFASDVFVSVNGSVDFGNGSFDNPYSSLSSAIDGACENDTIFLASGVYSGVNNSGLVVSKSLSIVSLNSSSPAVLDGGGVEDTILSCTGRSSIVLRDLVFRNGFGSDGGALFIRNAHVCLFSVLFEGNFASRGGAIYSLGTLEVFNSSFVSNKARVYGGAIKNWGYCWVFNSSFLSNYCMQTGGAVFNFGEGGIFIDSCVFSGNGAEYVGGTVHNVGFLNLSNSLVFNSSSRYGDGGVIANDIYGDDIGSAFISNLTVFGSYANGFGGAIFNNLDQDLVLVNSTFVNVSSRRGGVVYSLSNILVGGNRFFNSSSSYISFAKFYGGVLNISLSKGSIGLNESVLVFVNFSDDMGNIVFGSNVSLLLNGSLLFTGSGSFSYNLSSLGKGVYLLNASCLDTVGVCVSLTVFSTVFYSFSSLSVYVNTSSNFTGRVFLDGSPLAFASVFLNLTRLSNNLSKVYKLVCDGDGWFLLNINLAVGEYLVCIENRSVSLNVSRYTPNLQVNLTNSLIGRLYLDGFSFQNIPVSITLKRLSNSLSKTYYLFTDDFGFFSLAINLGTGEYAGEVSFSGNSLFRSVMGRVDFAVN